MHRRSQNTSGRLRNNQGALCSVCSDSSENLVLGKKWMTIFIMVRGTTSKQNGTELCGKRLLRLNKQLCHVGNQLEDCTLGPFQDASLASDLRDSHINVRRFYCAYLDHTRLFPFHGNARGKPQFLTSVPSLKLLRLTQVYVWMVFQLFNLGECVLDTFSCKAAMGHLERHTRDRVILSQSHSEVS